VLRHGERVLRVALDPQRQGLDALEEEPRVVRRDGGAQIAQRHGAGAQDIGQRREGLGQIVAPAQAVIAGVGLIEERMPPRAPVEFAAVHQHAPDPRAMAAEPFRQRMHDDVGAVGERLREVGSGEGGIDDERQPVRVGHVRHRLEIGHLERGIGNRLDKNRPRLVIDGGRDLIDLVGVHEANLDAEIGQDVLELGIAAAVEIAGAHDVVPGAGQIDDGVEDRARARGEAKRRQRVRALEQGDALLQHFRGGIADAGVDIPQLPQREEIRGVFGTVEHVRRGAVNRHRARVGGRVRDLPPVKGNGFESVGHDFLRV
jgi:hypothetical protein